MVICQAPRRKPILASYCNLLASRIELRITYESDKDVTKKLKWRYKVTFSTHVPRTA